MYLRVVAENDPYKPFLLASLKGIPFRFIPSTRKQSLLSPQRAMFASFLEIRGGHDEATLPQEATSVGPCPGAPQVHGADQHHGIHRLCPGEPCGFRRGSSEAPMWRCATFEESVPGQVGFVQHAATPKTQQAHQAYVGNVKTGGGGGGER